MFGFYNTVSLVLGVVAVLLPLIALFLKGKAIYSYFSMTAGLLSLCSQVAAYNVLVNKTDWSALMDTSDFTLFAAFILTVSAVVLNLILLIKRK